MKLHGRKIEGLNIETVVIPRSTGDLVFKAQAVVGYEEFDALCPAPNPPTIVKRGGETSKDITNPAYLKKMDDWLGKRSSWLILQSLSVTPELEWETVNMSESETWINFRQELKDSGLTPGEIARLIDAVTTACGLNQDKIEEATRRFLAGQEVIAKE